MNAVNNNEQNKLQFNKYEHFFLKGGFFMGYATERFAKRLKEIREAAGLTQAQFASELKVSRGTISYYEKGERTPDIEFLDSLYAYFECNLSIDFILGNTDNMKEEHRNMYDVYGLTDEACGILDRDPSIGKLISAILGHRDFDVIRSLYEKIIENYKSFDTTQLGYISFLVADLLNRIIFDSFKVLWGMQFTPEECEALRMKIEASSESLKKMLKEWDDEEQRRNDKFDKEFQEFMQRDKEENAVRYSAIDKVREKFFETVDHAEFRREHLK